VEHIERSRLVYRANVFVRFSYKRSPSSIKARERGNNLTTTRSILRSNTIGKKMITVNPDTKTDATQLRALAAGKITRTAVQSAWNDRSQTGPSITALCTSY
jgi:hypothetical protein